MECSVCGAGQLDVNGQCARCGGRPGNAASASAQPNRESHTFAIAPSRRDDQGVPFGIGVVLPIVVIIVLFTACFGLPLWLR